MDKFADEETDTIELELELSDLRRENDRLTRELRVAEDRAWALEEDVLDLIGELSKSEAENLRLRGTISHSIVE